MGDVVPATKGASEFLMIGDWGAEDAKAQAAVAAGMQRYAAQNSLSLEALLLLGDNWYGDLSGGTQSERWKTQFEDMYPSSSFPCSAYAVLGNHDYQYSPESKVSAELSYAKSAQAAGRQTRWTMPARWYRLEFPATNPVITVLFLDSNAPIDDGKQRLHRYFTLTNAEYAEQLQWLTKELEKPRAAPFLAVAAHHPIYSDGPHGDHAALIRDWDPLFRKHKVDLYLAGHDHDLQHLEFENHPTSYFLSGGGGANLYNLKIDPSERGPYGQKVYGFSHLSASSGKLTLRHLDATGRTLHAFTKTRDGKVNIAA